MNKKGFSLIEIIIVIAIISLIGIVITKISIDSKEKTINSKIKSDLESISNSLLAYSQKENKLPLPEGNKNYYKNSGGYSHEDFNNEKEPAFGVYGVTPETELKSFLSEIPRDPRTNQYYSYGKLRNDLDFEIVGIEKKGESYFSKVVGNYRGDKGLIGLVREYNGPHFISDGASSLPFNPEKILLSATDLNGNIFNEKDILEYKGGKILKNGENINFTKSENKYYDLYISDGSIARLDLSSDVKITFGKDNNLFNFIRESNKESKISMLFEAGSAWIFASNTTKTESEIILSSQDVVAAVRGTIFKFDADNSEVKVYKGKVMITKGVSEEIETTGSSNDEDIKNFIIKALDSNKSEINLGEKREVGKKVKLHIGKKECYEEIYLPENWENLFNHIEGNNYSIKRSSNKKYDNQCTDN